MKKSKFDEVCLNLLDGTFDIICLTETWTHQFLDNGLIQCNGYQLIRQDRFVKNRGGGLCIYLKDSIQFRMNANSINDDDLELLSITVEREFQKDIVTILVYRPTSGNIINYGNFCTQIIIRIMNL